MGNPVLCFGCGIKQHDQIANRRPYESLVGVGLRQILILLDFLNHPFLQPVGQDIPTQAVTNGDQPRPFEPIPARIAVVVDQFAVNSFQRRNHRRRNSLAHRLAVEQSNRCDEVVDCGGYA